MFYLYKKTHNVTKLQYLGYTKHDPVSYKGSGVVWTRHLAKHGNDVTTEVLETCESKDQVKDRGRYYSVLWNIVESDMWANLKLEEADGGDMRGSSTWVEGRKRDSFRQTQRDGAIGNTNVRGKLWWVDPVTQHKVRSAEPPGPTYVRGFMKRSEEIKQQVSQKLQGRQLDPEHRAKISARAKGRTSNNKGTVWVINDEGKRRRVDPNNIPENFRKVTEK